MDVGTSNSASAVEIKPGAECSSSNTQEQSEAVSSGRSSTCRCVFKCLLSISRKQSIVSVHAIVAIPMLKVYGRRIFTHPYRLINNAASLCSNQHCFYGLPCPQPYCRSRYTRVSRATVGSFLWSPRHGYRLIWESQPYTGSTPAGNILISAAILYSGLIQAKASRPFRTL